MAATLALAIGLVPRPAAALTAAETSAARTAMADIDHGKWDDARQTAEHARFPLLGKLVEWLYLTRPGANAGFAELTGFIDANQDWPSQGLLKRHVEDSITDSTPPAQIVAWFDRTPPVSAGGAARYIDALNALHQTDRAVATARQFLIDGAMPDAQLAVYAGRYQPMLRPADFELRADRLIWAHDTDGANQVMRYLTPEARAVAQARLALASQASNAQTLVSHLTQEQQNDLGLLYERMRWLVRQNRDAEAITLLGIAPPTLPHADQWWNQRALLARRALENGDAKTAYELSRDHRQASGAALADGEWLAGWIALRFLNDPKAALDHFDQMLKIVSTPLSVSRAAYWAGRSEEAIGDQAAAKTYYGKAAIHIGAFYGQLALAKLNPDAPLTLPPQPNVAALEAHAFSNSELVQVVDLFNAIGLGDRIDPFVRRIGELARTPDDALLAMKLAKQTNSLAAEVSVAKKLMQGGMQVLADGYPVIAPLGTNRPEPALIHSIIRQESLFDSSAVSSAGAMGLMQLMPASAKSIAAKLGIKKYNPAMLTDGRSNVSLGSTYLADLVDRYKGSYVLAAAAYNGGPGSVNGWLKDNGDPRGRSLDDMIDWIEKIGFAETRNYVQRVMENLQIYRARIARIDGKTARDLIAEDLAR